MPRKSRPKAPKKVDFATHARRAAEKFASGKLAAAAKHCRQALKADPQAADLWHLLALSLLGANELEAALQVSLTSCRLAPDQPSYANTHALIVEQSGDYAAAEAAYRELLRAHPDHLDALYNLARLLARRGEYRPAIAGFERALQLKPDWAAACSNLGHAYFELGDQRAAERAFRDVLRLAPQHPEASLNLARLRHQDDDFETAAELFRLALANVPSTAILLRLATLHPVFCNDADEISGHRTRIRDDLRTIAEAELPLEDPALTLGAPLFYCAYHGRNDLELMSSFGDIVARAWRPARLPPPVRGRRRPRVALVSAHFKEHTIGRLYVPLVERLQRDDFELAILSLGRHDDGIARRFDAAADLSIAVDYDHQAARRALNDIDADVIFYPDIGLEPISLWLAAERHAALQSTGWGHPVTSGLTTVDYFLSSTLLEPPDAAQHYRENLVQLPSWPVCYEDPGRPLVTPLTRKDFGFDARQRLFICPQSLFKLHPGFDAYLAAILRRDKDACIVLVGSREAWRQKLKARFAAHLGPLATRIHFIPAQSSEAFSGLLALADVVLDTVYFSGGMTSFETIWAETPFVTERGAFMRGRVTAGLCDLIDLDAAVVAGAESYAERALELAAVGPARRAFVDALAMRKHRLLSLDESVVPAYQEFFNEAIASVAALTAERVAS